MAKPKLTMVSQVGTFFGRLEFLLIAWNFFAGRYFALKYGKEAAFL